MDLRSELLAIRERRGKLTPRVVVEEARPVSSPLHSRFEWDDKIAGEAYRLQQGHELIRSVRLKVFRDDGQRLDVRAFQAIRREDPDNSGYAYEPSEEVAEDPLLRELALRNMEREWKTLLARFRHFSEFVEMVRRDLEDAA